MTNSFNDWKSKKYYICQSGWQLWICLTLLQNRKMYSTIDGAYFEPHTKEDYKNAVRSIPGPRHPTCRCKDCRYHRIVYKK